MASQAIRSGAFLKCAELAVVTQRNNRSFEFSRRALFLPDNSFSGATLSQDSSSKRLSKNFERRHTVSCAATTESPEVSQDERKKALESSVAEKSYKIVEVEATSQNEYNSAKVLASTEVSTGVKQLTLEAEISREFVKLNASYRKPGQQVQVRLASGDIEVVPASSAPFPTEQNHSVLLKARGDIPAGSNKLAQYSLSVKSPLDLYVSEETAPGLYAAEIGSEVEIGPFLAGPDYRPILFIARFTTVLIFASGQGISSARALISAKDTGSLSLNMREEVRLYYSGPSPSSLAYKDEWSEWESKGVKLRPTVESASGEEWDGFVGSVAELFDEDDLEYDPETTSAVLFGSKAENDKAVRVLQEAEIPERAIVRVDL